MKKINVVWGALALVLLFSFSVGAASFQVDGSYLFGFGEHGSLKSESNGFAVHGSVEIIPNVLVDGSFLSLNYTKLGTDKITTAVPEKALSERVVTFGGLYQVVSDQDLQVFVGAGLANYNSEAGKDTKVEGKGKGIYGKLGLNFELMPKVNLLADLSYAPKFKYEEKDGTFVTARATVSYDLFNDISLQGTAKYYKTDVSGQTGDVTSANTLVGGGVVFSF